MVRNRSESGVRDHGAGGNVTVNPRPERSEFRFMDRDLVVVVAAAERRDLLADEEPAVAREVDRRDDDGRVHGLPGVDRGLLRVHRAR